MEQKYLYIAEMYGSIDYASGVKCIPAQSVNVMKMIEGRKIGKTPKNEPTTLDIFDAWTKGWLDAMKAENQ